MVCGVKLRQKNTCVSFTWRPKVVVSWSNGPLCTAGRQSWVSWRAVVLCHVVDIVASEERSRSCGRHRSVFVMLPPTSAVLCGDRYIPRHRSKVFTLLEDVLPHKITQHPLPSPFSKVNSAARVAASKTSSTPSPLKLEHSRYFLAPISLAAASPSCSVTKRWDFLRISSMATGSSRKSFLRPTSIIGTLGHFSVASSTHCGTQHDGQLNTFNSLGNFSLAGKGMLLIGTVGPTQESRVGKLLRRTDFR